MGWATLEVHLLGDLQVLQDGRQAALPASRRSRALLGYLIATGRAHRRERLCELLWATPDDPRAALRWSLWKLRPLLDHGGTRRLVADREQVAFETHGADVDVVAVRIAMRGGTGAATTDALVTSVRRFRGDFLEGLDLPDCYAFQEWCLAERESLRALRLDMLATLVCRLAEDPETALRYARERAGLDPLSEDAHIDLIRLLARLGRHRDALNQHDTCRRILGRELATRPSVRLAQARACLVQATSVEPVLEPPPPPAPVPRALPLLGREAECALLDRLVATARARGQTDVLFVGGDPGIGKSRLLDELQRRVRGSGGLVLSGRAFEAERARPYGAWVDALSAAPLSDLPDDLRGEVARLLPQRMPQRAEPTDRTRLYDALGRMLAWLARQELVCVAIDDMQWLDEASISLLHFCVRQGASGVIFALAARSGELCDNPSALRLVRELGRERRLSEVALGPLARPAVASLVAEISPTIDAERVFLESEGHPLYALEIARAGFAPGRAAVDSLDALIAERLMKLDDRARELLPWMAAMGRTFEADILAEATGLPPGTLIAALDDLERRGIVRVTDERYDFQHDLIRRAAYRRIASPQRRLIHARIARVLGARDDAGRVFASDVVRHADLGGDSALCAAACVRACERCLEVFAHVEAEAFVELGRRHAEHLPTGDRIRIHLRLLSFLVHPGLRLHRPGTLGTEIADLCAEAQAADLRSECSLGFHLLGRLHHMGFGDIPRARAALVRAVEVLEKLPPEPNIEPLIEGARCLAFLEIDIPRARTMFDQLSRIRGVSESLAFQWGLGLVLHWDGDLDGARRTLEAAIALARHRRKHWAEFEVLSALATVELEVGCIDRVLQLRHDLARLAERLGEDGGERPLAEALEALARYRRGDPDASRAVDAAARELERADSRYHLAYVLNSAAEIDLLRGRLSDARRRTAAALASATIVERTTEIQRARLISATADAREGDAEHAKTIIADAKLGNPACLAARSRAILSALRPLLST